VSTHKSWKKREIASGFAYVFQKAGYAKYVLHLIRQPSGIKAVLTKENGPRMQIEFEEIVPFASYCSFYEESAIEWAENQICSPMEQLRDRLQDFAFYSWSWSST
jgi:hypothetical protein